MSALADHAVTSTICPMIYHIIDRVQLYFTNGSTNIVLKVVDCLWIVGVTLILTPQIRVQRPPTLNSECSFGCVAIHFITIHSFCNITMIFKLMSLIYQNIIRYLNFLIFRIAVSQPKGECQPSTEFRVYSTYTHSMNIYPFEENNMTCIKLTLCVE